MDDCWTPMVERIVFSTFKRGLRVVAVTSPRPVSGVTTLCEELARITSLGGTKTLLLDMGGPAEENVPSSVWHPCQGNAGQSITGDKQGFDRLIARFTVNDRFKFNNTDWLRRAFNEDLSGYEAIIVDTSPIPTIDTAFINGASAAAACDGAIIVCMTGQFSRSQLLECQDALSNAQVSVLGLVLNEMHSPTLGDELAREARRFHRFLPRFCNWLERKALASTFLN